MARNNFLKRGHTWYERHILPHLIERACRSSHATELRRQLIPQASGRVLEVGFGTGLNLAHYDPARVEHLWGIDPGTGMERYAQARAAAAAVPVTLLPVSGEAIPFPEQFFDTVVTTYTLCTIPDVDRALREMLRVLRPGGRLLFCEHGLAADGRIGRIQQRINPVWRLFSGGCNLDRNIAALIGGAGFELDQVAEAPLITGFSLVAWMSHGSATHSG
jgi:ubiquinone/menaquinone biosynthesis C-methylase UbiE